MGKCSRCSKKNLECHYDTVDRRRRSENQQIQTDANSSGNDSSNQSLSEYSDDHQLIKHSVNGKTIEVYIYVTSMGIPCFKPEEYYKLLQCNMEELNKNRRDQLALLLSIQTICEQIFGFPDLAEQTARKCKKVVMHLYDDFSNPFVACTFLNMATYYSAEGDIEMARGYIALVENFIDRMKLTSQLFEYELIPKFNIEFCITSMKIVTPITSLACCDSYPIPDVPILTKIFGLLSSMHVFHPSYEIEFWNNNLSPTIENRINNLEIFSVLAAIYENKLTDVSKKLMEVTKEVFFNGLNIIRLILHASKIDNSKLYANTRLLEFYALKVSKLSENNLFIYMTPYVMSFVLSSIKVNFEVCKMIDRGERVNLQTTLVLNNEMFENSTEVVDYYSVLNRDLETLKQLSKRYRYITTIYNEVNTFLNNRANMCQSNIQLDGLTSSPGSLSSLFDPPSNIYSEMRNFLSTFGKSRNLLKTTDQEKPICDRITTEEEFCNYFGFEPAMDDQFPPNNR
ncbi:predicted protein [Naegleria gruberi]|uniref:Predicted protein n=1 Tax=Naegleria gruberi TaxID=5762 RepID=D2W027_NAEGR|nr:uncharacterized protein NAEGRDRAFT_53633 [Naegleria gruberi]EFC37500.1 predicted protein [Naegleria gruberi]|eukprot:XP_002670244.1 predicted protein [Naegleria gruberi strain NEG-M]